MVLNKNIKMLYFKNYFVGCVYSQFISNFKTMIFKREWQRVLQ